MGNISLTDVATLLGELAVLIGAIAPLIVSNRRIREGLKCQMRAEMLRTYYRHVDDGRIRQYEYENFVALYEAYKAMKGNSFIEKVYKEVQTWEVIS